MTYACSDMGNCVISIRFRQGEGIVRESSVITHERGSVNSPPLAGPGWQNDTNPVAETTRPTPRMH